MGGLTVDCCNIATVNMTTAVGYRKTQLSFWFATLFNDNRVIALL